MRLRTVLPTFLVLAASEVHAQAPACDEPEHRQFDFWVGDWEIDQRFRGSDGEWIELDARTSVRPILDGCALAEHWEGRVQYPWQGMTGPVPMKGFSIRHYDPESGEWVIRWMDTLAPSLGAGSRGRFEEEVGSFYQESTRPDGTTATSRIRFFDIEEGAVRWDLAISTDDRETWTTIWEMDMRRMEEGGR